MLYHLLDRDSSINVPIKHPAYQIYAVFAHDVWNAKVAVHYLVDAVEWVLFINNCVEKYAESPNVLLLAAIWLPGEDFWCGVIWKMLDSETKKPK